MNKFFFQLEEKRVTSLILDIRAIVKQQLSRQIIH